MTSVTIKTTWMVSLAFIALSAGACGSDSVSAEAAWKLGCSSENKVGTCTGGARQFSGDDGTNGVSVSCRVENRGTQTTVFFSIKHGDDYGLSVSNAVIEKGTASVSNNGCMLTAFDDDGVDFTGTCGTSNSLPCVFTEINVDGSSINGTFKCMNIASTVDSGALRNLTSPTNGDVSFRFSGCDSL